MPRVPQVVGKEAPRMSTVLIREQDPHAIHLGKVPRAVVMPPNDAQEQRPRRPHDGDVRQHPAPIILRQCIYNLQEKRMMRHAAHGVVADARRGRAPHPRRVREQGVHPTLTPVVQIEVHAAKVREDEVPDGVGALDRERIAIECFQKPRVFFGDELSRELVRPQLVFPVGM